MYPTSANKAFLALGMAPGNPAKLEARAKLESKNLDDVTIPMGCVKLFKGGRGTALEVEIMPTPEKALESFKGWGIVPLVLQVDDIQRPKSEEIRKELWSFMRKCRGHNMVPGVAAYYDSDDPTAWPQKVYKELKQDEVWPEFRDQGAGGASTATTGRTLPKIVTTAKYNVRPEGGYNAQSMSPALKGKYKEVLAQAANSSLASKTWSSYSTVLKQLPHIAEATGVRMDFPMTAGMIQAVLAYYLDKGLKSATIQGYLASLRNIHQVKGLACPALDDKLVQTILKGAKNLESTKMAESQDDAENMEEPTCITAAIRHQEDAVGYLHHAVLGEPETLRGAELEEGGVRRHQDPVLEGRQTPEHLYGREGGLLPPAHPQAAQDLTHDAHTVGRNPRAGKRPVCGEGLQEMECWEEGQARSRDTSVHHGKRGLGHGGLCEQGAVRPAEGRVAKNHSKGFSARLGHHPGQAGGHTRGAQGPGAVDVQGL